MALLNQFQQYSQGENTVTNNVLLMLSNLYEINPKYYEEYIKGLTEDPENYEVIPSFRQQVGNKGDGIIDGYIQLKASKIIIETKLHGLEWIDKLLKYTKSFEQNEINLLFHLSSKKYSETEIKVIEEKLSDINSSLRVKFHSLTYLDLVDQLKELTSVYPFEYNLKRLCDNFESYCFNMNLTQIGARMLRAMACGESFDLNVKHQFYFDLASRGFSNFKYLGIYKGKSVRYIGELENVIVADRDEKNGLRIIDSDHPTSEDQKSRLAVAIKESIDAGWEIGKDHLFFLLKNFTKTDFKKTSPGGIFRVRYFDLDQILGKKNRIY